MNKLLVFLFLVTASACTSPKALDNPLYAFNNCMRTMLDCPEGTPEQVEAIAALGYGGFGGHESVDLVSLKRELDAREMGLPEIYVGIYLREGKVVLPDNWKAMLDLFKGTETLLALHVHADDNASPDAAVDRIFVEKFRELAQQAEEYQVQLAVYPHHAFYCETTAHAADLVKLVGHPRFGMTLNLCHLLKVEGSAGWEQKVEGLIPYLKMVSIHGADAGDTQAMGWDQLIQPLGEGSFDTFRFVQHLKDTGYEGIFGLQCFGIQQDCSEALRKSMEAWRSFQQRYTKR
ncbi:MAG: sugar phosphate isomerase/epimerase [Lunatimonas sp.]|uniref:sugar phosphate isomerase/epimerase family protein n=1 Tax=Lunatimonas sp. TaxID=2060141 RepID=UPI00263A5323|nr:sugar phosphate isomerase/epimerase family protein [Lunatimonas sp.]MCC5939308.1 sugar phosphate isomerase/epimerase [Lunatimonas sp.]